jgi:beta-galactosidase
VGYNEGAQEPAEYNITPYLRKGKNTIAVMVTKYSDGYYLEGQDYWRLAGIFDDVWVMATPKTRLMDWQVITDLDENYRDAELQINTFIKNYGASMEGLQVKALLSDKNGQQMAVMQGAVPVVADRQMAQTSLKKHVTITKVVL